MDLRKGKKGLIVKTWERCTSLGVGGREKLRSKSWPRSIDESVLLRDCKNNNKTGRVHDPVSVPVGCFSVYVGNDKQRFVLKTGCLNHPLFLKLLEEAETEYGFKRNGPIELPCEVDDFLKVLLEMDCDDVVRPNCTFGNKSKSSYHLLASPKIFVGNNSKSSDHLLASPKIFFGNKSKSSDHLLASPKIFFGNKSKSSNHLLASPKIFSLKRKSRHTPRP